MINRLQGIWLWPTYNAIKRLLPVAHAARLQQVQPEYWTRVKKTIPAIPSATSTYRGARYLCWPMADLPGTVSLQRMK